MPFLAPHLGDSKGVVMTRARLEAFRKINTAAVVDWQPTLHGCLQLAHGPVGDPLQIYGDRLSGHFAHRMVMKG